MSGAEEPLDIVFLDRESLPEGITLRSPSFPHRLAVYPRSTPVEAAGRIVNADIVITNKAKLPAEAISGAKRLKLVAVSATGADNVDLAACAARGIPVANVRNYAGHTVPEHTFALLLALRRSILAYRQSVAAGRWQESGQFCFFDHPIRDLAGSTMGIIGGGVIGTAVGDLARAFGMSVLFAGRKGSAKDAPGRTPFAEVLARSDVISLHLPLTAETRGLIGAPEFAQMARRPILINASRGGLVDEAVLERALKGGQIAGAGFDVATAEPPPADHVLMRLLDLPNFLLTPHVAWASREAIQALADQVIDNVEAWQRGEPRNLVGR